MWPTRRSSDGADGVPLRWFAAADHAPAVTASEGRDELEAAAAALGESGPPTEEGSCSRLRCAWAWQEAGRWQSEDPEQSPWRNLLRTLAGRLDPPRRLAVAAWARALTPTERRRRRVAGAASRCGTRWTRRRSTRTYCAHMAPVTNSESRPVQPSPGGDAWAVMLQRAAACDVGRFAPTAADRARPGLATDRTPG